jgi:rod shape determining protein RodA
MQRYLRNLDWILIIAVGCLMAIGLVLIFSATHGGGYGWMMKRQALFMAVGIVLTALSLTVDYKQLSRIGIPLYVFMVLLLLAVMLFGHAQMGAQRWLRLGAFAFQPSEFCKGFLIVCLATFLNTRTDRLLSFTDYLPAMAFTLVPFLLVVKQPDLGTAIVFLAIALFMFLMCGFKMRWLALGTVVGCLSLPAVWHFLKEYQKNRLRVFLDPELDPFGAGYHVIQSKIAIGSGMLLGKGWLQGTQSQLNFLPENHTDFIFAVAGEEFGFIGTVIIILLYAIIIWRGLSIALNATDNFGTLLAIGITGMFFFHVLVNVGMTLGIMPVTGVPLPFVSYGASSLTINLLLVGLLLNINLQREQLQF